MKKSTSHESSPSAQLDCSCSWPSRSAPSRRPPRARGRKAISIANTPSPRPGSRCLTGSTCRLRWDGKSSLPILLFLHGAGANESTYLDMADGLIEKLAEQHGYIVVSPLGFTPLGAYGNPLRLPAVFGQSEAAAAQRAAVTPERRRELDLSELEVITVLEIVTEEYGADRSRTFLAGHSMGSGGVWHLAARYPERWRAIAPMSGPFIDKRDLSVRPNPRCADLHDRGYRRRAVACGQPSARSVLARRATSTSNTWRSTAITAAWCRWSGPRSSITSTAYRRAMRAAWSGSTRAS